MIYINQFNLKHHTFSGTVRPMFLAILMVMVSNAMAGTFIPNTEGESPTLRSVEVNAHGEVRKVDAAASTRVQAHLSEEAPEEEPHTHEVIRQVPARAGKSSGKIHHEKVAPGDHAEKSKEHDNQVNLNQVHNQVHKPVVLEKEKDEESSRQVSKKQRTGEPKHLGTFDMWTLFFGCISILLVVDITVVKRLSTWQQDRRNIFHIFFWILATLGYAGIMYLKAGAEVGAMWLDGYFMELAMNIDTFFVLTVIFACWKTPPQVRHKPLQYGMIIGIPARIFMYMAMEDVVELGRAPKVILGFLLIGFGIMAWCSAGEVSASTEEEDEEQEDFLKYTLVTYMGKIIPVTPLYKEDFFFEEGKATLLFFVMLCIELAQALFSVDAVSAKITEIPDVYIAATSTIFGMFTVRALYFIFDLLIAAFAYMQYGVAVILSFLGLKLLFPVTLDIPLPAFFLLISCVLLACVVLSMLYPREMKGFEDSPENWKSIQEVHEREKGGKKKADRKKFGTCQGLMSTNADKEGLMALRQEVESSEAADQKVDPASSSTQA
jgi:tellurite resistance protein TerC